MESKKGLNIVAEFEKTEVGEIKTTVKVEDPKFTKKALISSKKFTPIERDVLRLVLYDDKEYNAIRSS